MILVTGNVFKVLKKRVNEFCKLCLYSWTVFKVWLKPCLIWKTSLDLWKLCLENRVLAIQKKKCNTSAASSNLSERVLDFCAPFVSMMLALCLISSLCHRLQYLQYCTVKHSLGIKPYNYLHSLSYVCQIICIINHVWKKSHLKWQIWNIHIFFTELKMFHSSVFSASDEAFE